MKIVQRDEQRMVLKEYSPVTLITAVLLLLVPVIQH